jgi:4-hydroxy-tetrahydrodipicolinate reductase
MSRVRVAIAGIFGRMGQNLLKVIHQRNIVTLGAILASPRSLSTASCANKTFSTDIGKITATDDFNSVVEDFDILIDFTRPESSLNYIELCRKYKKSIVIGTTGFDDTAKLKITAASKEIGIIISANFSMGINLILKVLGDITKSIENDVDIEIIDAHHRHKVDAPSGTALAMGEAITLSMQGKLDKHATYPRTECTGPRKAHSIGFSSIRAGDIIGDHTAIFASEGERIEVTHKASSRTAFSIGAVHAAAWLQGRKAGLYSMQDIMDSKE